MADLALKELAVVIGVHRETLRRLAQAGKLPGIYRCGKKWRISREAADKLRQIPKAKEA